MSDLGEVVHSLFRARRYLAARKHLSSCVAFVVCDVVLDSIGLFGSLDRPRFGLPRVAVRVPLLAQVSQ